MVDSNKKVRNKTVRSRLNNNDSLSVDSRMLEMLKQIEVKAAEPDFQYSLAQQSEKILGTLKRARIHLKNTDNAKLEESALELSNHALRVGAINILKSSFELQNVARYSDFVEAELIVQSLEAEYLKVRRDLEKVG